MDLIQGFNDIESVRVGMFLNKLLAGFDSGNFVIVGGLAIRYHLVNKSIPFKPKAFNDLDIVVKESSILKPDYFKSFLIYHYHPKSFFLVLVDVETKIKCDVFLDPQLKDVENIPFGNNIVQIATPEAQLVKTVLDTTKILSEIAVDPKQFTDAKLLMEVADMSVADDLWKKGEGFKIATDLKKAFGLAERQAKLRPDLLVDHPFRKTTPYKCRDCKSVSGFVVTPMKKIYRVLGYVE